MHDDDDNDNDAADIMYGTTYHRTRAGTKHRTILVAIFRKNEQFLTTRWSFHEAG
jgi:hypothetical protein